MKFALLIGFYLVLKASFAQEIKGRIIDDLSNSVFYASVTIKDTDSTGNILSFTIAKEGFYSVTLKEQSPNIVIEVRAANYRVGYKQLREVKGDSTYTVDFSLNSLKNVQLEEVTITAEKYPFQVKKDTIVYDVSRYADLNSKKIEDVIKKLPGVEVNETTGEIKYRGKSIETVAIEGDNLFGYNYALGTKNINANIVEKIEAIEKFSENPLLKGIENSEKVALNLKLKKGQIDFSADVETGIGISQGRNEVRHLNGTLLGVASKLKSFATLASNNIGVNHSPFNYLTSGLNPEQLKEKEFFAQRIIQPTSYTSSMDENRSNINNQFFGSLSSIFKIGTRLSAKINLYHLKDDISSEQLLASRNIVNNQTISWFNDNSLVKNPKLYRGDLNIKGNTSANSLVEYNIKIKRESIDVNSDIKTNSSNSFRTMLETKDSYLNQQLLFTKRISRNKAFQTELTNTTNNIPQTYSVDPSIINSSFFDRDIQQSSSKKNFYEAKGILLGSNGSYRYTITTGANFSTSALSTLLYLEDSLNSNISFSQNELHYTKRQIFTSSSISFSFNKIKFAPSYSLTYLKQTLQNTVARDKSFDEALILEPSIAAQYSINDISLLFAKISYSQIPQVEEHLYTNGILTNNRTLTSNSPDFSLQKRIVSQVSFITNDLYNQFQLTTSIGYQKNIGSYFDNINFDENFTIINSFFLGRQSDDITSDFNVSKYLPFLFSTIQVKSNFTFSKYFNVVNDSEIRINRSRFNSSEFSISTAFDIPINFSNTFVLSQNSAKTDLGSKFRNVSFSNSFTLTTKLLKNWLFSSTSDYYVPNSDAINQDFFILDGMLSFKPDNRKYEISLAARNILNTNFFQKVDTSDYSESIFRINIIPRFYLMYFAVRL